MVMKKTTNPAGAIAVWTPETRAGEDVHTNPETGKPWTREEAEAAVKWARLHGIDAEIWTD